MGDMKTPDFDDLLAAFDIPDIDATQAIQANSEESRDDTGTNVCDTSTRTPSCFPSTDPPVVSVIVKNTVRSDSSEEEKTSMEVTKEPSEKASICQAPVKSNLAQTHVGIAPSLEPTVSTSAVVEAQVSNGLDVSSGRGKAAPHSWSSPLHSSCKYQDEETATRSSHLTIDKMNTARPLMFTQCSTSADMSFSLPPLTQRKACHQDSLLPLSLVQKEDTKTDVCPILSSDVESEPDLGSPLVIQESPERVMSPPPIFKKRGRFHSDLFSSPDKNLCTLPDSLAASFNSSQTEHQRSEESKVNPASPSTSDAPSHTPNACSPSIVTNSSVVQEKLYPEHVIDERDSPESPPPSETGCLITNQSCSPRAAARPGESTTGGTLDQTQNVTGEQDDANWESCDTINKDPVSSCRAERPSPLLRPLKVKIKMASKSVTRTPTGGGSKKSTPQETDGVKEENTGETRAKASAIAVDITKNTVLPSVSSAKVTPGGYNLSSLGQKTLNTQPHLSSLPLLPSQASSKPASIVNNTGAIVSKNQTNMVEAFNKILNNKNLLPTYKPELSSPLPTEWGISLPSQGYRCLECGDAFALEQSLAQHYDRRSLRIEVTCNHCAKRLIFFNKCSLLLHAREHKEKGLIMQCSHLVMKPVPVDQMIFQPEPAAATSPVLASVTSKSMTHLMSLNASRGPESVQSGSHKCHECHAHFRSKEELSEHFQEVKSRQSTACTECSPPMLLPNSCAAAAHQRIHQGGTPHCCPECGSTFKQSVFQKHLQENCLHFSRRVGYRCSSCLVVFGGLNSVKSHIQQAHCDVFHKCPSCPMAFKSAPSVQSHITAQHPDHTDGQTMIIYKCVMCDTVFTYKHVLYSHFDTHLTNQRVHVFKCPECSKLFSQRNSLLDHFKTHKTPTIKEEPFTSSINASANSKNSAERPAKKEKKGRVRAERTKLPSAWKCTTCDTQYTERENYIKHMSEQHGKVLKQFPCNKCESSFTTTSSMRRHIRDKHKVAARVLRCQFCSESKKTFSSRLMLDRHIQLRHSVNSSGQDAALEGDEADSSSEQESGTRTRRKRRGVKAEPSASELSPPKKLCSSASSQPPSSLPESVFSCAPCGFTTDDKVTFQEHIGQHRQSGGEGGGLQCLQCGACFTSSSSLSRHRFISHKVKDPSCNSPQNTSTDPTPQLSSKSQNDRGHVNGSAPASPCSLPPGGQEKDEDLACRVCGKQFEKSADLNTHFRTHGMAFIIARNAGKTT